MYWQKYYKNVSFSMCHINKHLLLVWSLSSWFWFGHIHLCSLSNYQVICDFLKLCKYYCPQPFTQWLLHPLMTTA